MGVAFSALIVYGIDLGGPVNGWKVREVDAGRLTTDWGVDAGPGEELWDFVPFVGHLGVEVELYGDWESPSLLLVTHSHKVSSHELLDLSYMQERHDYSAWGAALKQALTELGLTPHQQRPCWLASSFYG